MKEAAVIGIDTVDLFKFQLERNALTDIPYELTLLCSSNVDDAKVYGSLDWEEISR